MPLEHVTLERRDAVLIAHLDDGKANALSMSMIAAINQVLDQADADLEIGSVVLHGREGKFCAGFDLGVMRSGDLVALAELVCAGGDLEQRLYGNGVPVVAACTGHALAAGALLLLGCDVRIAADVECKIGLNEVAIGMVLPDWAMSIAVERLSRRHLQRAVANARLTGPVEAVQVGFLDQVVPAHAVLDSAVAAATELASLHPRAYAGTVRKLRGGLLDSMAAHIAMDRALGSVPTV